MQVTPYNPAGFAVHKIAIGDYRYSAYFDGAGNLQDCERYRAGTFREIEVSRRYVKIRAELAAIGRRIAYAATHTETVTA